MIGLLVFEPTKPWVCPRCQGKQRAHTQVDENGHLVQVYTRRCVPVLVADDGVHSLFTDGRIIPLPEGIETTPLWGTDEYRETNPSREVVASGE